jgi:hypothetical protein
MCSLLALEKFKPILMLKILIPIRLLTTERCSKIEHDLKERLFYGL